MHSDKAQLQRAKARHAAIKKYYLSRGHTEQQWQEVAADNQQFNQVWRRMLRLPASDAPPPEEFRR